MGIRSTVGFPLELTSGRLGYPPTRVLSSSSIWTVGTPFTPITAGQNAVAACALFWLAARLLRKHHWLPLDQLPAQAYRPPHWPSTAVGVGLYSYIVAVVAPAAAVLVGWYCCSNSRCCTGASRVLMNPPTKPGLASHQWRWAPRRDQLRAFFRQCFPLLLRRLYGID